MGIGAFWYAKKDHGKLGMCIIFGIAVRFAGKVIYEIRLDRDISYTGGCIGKNCWTYACYCAQGIDAAKIISTTVSGDLQFLCSDF